MDTSYVAVGTVMSMITDSLTCCPQKSPAGTGRRCRSWCRASWPAPAIHAAQHERAGRAGVQQARPALPLAGCPCTSQRRRPSYTVSPHERAGRDKGLNATGSTADLSDQESASGGGHLMRSHSQGIVNFTHFCVIAILDKQVAQPPPRSGSRARHRRRCMVL